MKKLTKEKLRRYKLVCIFSYSKFAFSYKIYCVSQNINTDAKRKDLLVTVYFY